ncbi:hypothetical protein SAMN02745163_04213 [Clostridium cavendishii DSM 21758]|uniref:Outer surface protein n=1 Tax=Clostridium cavendishii DSM 21758 TaxID=1121302 RepID=A0A1M6U8Q0_9CLOT|nr:MupG family TIM beta-alpha barrel fold protein [Clostridium cavendishii]SHK65543.1 hypothetical protein SAMN02745163_04213 [Clostridium cavendishii DSM 21758]
MKRLGISVYPNHTSIEEINEYIELAAKYGFKRIFTCLLSAADKEVEEIVTEFKKMLDVANKYGMEVIADLDPTVFKKLEASIYDLGVFKEMGLSGIRLDMGFSGFEESVMTFNKYGLKVELNVSNGTKYVDNILSYQTNLNNLYGCHNFYPHVYTGLSYENFISCSKQFKDLGIRTAAFVNSPSAEHGPWPVSEGLCTLEMHRDLPIEVQAKHLFATGLIDDVIIANAFASEEELKALSEINTEMLEFNVELIDEIRPLDKTIVLDEFHFNRGDCSEYMARSTQSRVKYKGESFPAYNTPDIKRGDVLIDSDAYTRYAGELQLALKDMKNSGKTNVVGKVIEEEVFLLDYIKPWSKFAFKLKSKK